MEQELFKDKTDAFCLSMRQSGYSGRYIRVNERGLPLDYPMELKECLTKYIKEGLQKALLRLETKPNHAPYIRCVFTIDVDEAKVFRVREMFLRDTNTSKEETIRIHDNREISGNQAVIAKFPKPKPWGKYIKGKYGI